VRGGFPDVESALAERGFHTVDLGLRNLVTVWRRAYLKPLAGCRQGVEVGAPQRPQPQGFGRHIRACLGGLEVSAQSAQVRAEPLDGLLGRRGQPSLLRPAQRAYAAEPGETRRRRQQERHDQLDGHRQVNSLRTPSG
jgi:hypothetical protein